jgi:hypothetical protein
MGKLITAICAAAITRSRLDVWKMVANLSLTSTQLADTTVAMCKLNAANSVSTKF